MPPICHSEATPAQSTCCCPQASSRRALASAQAMGIECYFKSVRASEHEQGDEQVNVMEGVRMRQDDHGSEHGQGSGQGSGQCSGQGSGHGRTQGTSSKRKLAKSVQLTAKSKRPATGSHKRQKVSGREGKGKSAVEDGEDEEEIAEAIAEAGADVASDGELCGAAS